MHVHTYLETAALGGQYLELLSSPWPTDFPKVMVEVSARSETNPALLKPNLKFKTHLRFPPNFVFIEFILCMHSYCYPHF